MTRSSGLPDACWSEDDNVFCEVDGNVEKMEDCVQKLGVNSFCVSEEGERHYFPDKIFNPNMDEDKKVESKSEMFAVVPESINPKGKNLKEVLSGPSEKKLMEKDIYWAGRLADLGGEGAHYQIENRLGNVVRDVRVKEDTILVDAYPSREEEPPIELPKELDILYEPWIMGRGSFLFVNPTGNHEPEGQLLKFGTEDDRMEVLINE